jgi:hypothetical protein
LTKSSLRQPIALHTQQIAFAGYPIYLPEQNRSGKMDKLHWLFG